MCQFSWVVTFSNAFSGRSSLERYISRATVEIRSFCKQFQKDSKTTITNVYLLNYGHAKAQIIYPFPFFISTSQLAIAKKGKFVRHSDWNSKCEIVLLESNSFRTVPEYIFMWLGEPLQEWSIFQHFTTTSVYWVALGSRHISTILSLLPRFQPIQLSLKALKLVGLLGWSPQTSSRLPRPVYCMEYT